MTLSGGSAFGLESSSGVMQYLSEHEIGFDMKNIYIPIVCEACLFDCGVGNSKAYPNKQMGYDACIEAEKMIQNKEMSVLEQVQVLVNSLVLNMP